MYIGEQKPGKPRRGAEGKTSLLIAAQEDGKITGRIRLKHIVDASAKSLKRAVQEMVEQGAAVKTDDCNGYKGLNCLGYRHLIVRKTATTGDTLLPLCHREASLIKRWFTA